MSDPDADRADSGEGRPDSAPRDSRRTPPTEPESGGQDPDATLDAPSPGSSASGVLPESAETAVESSADPEVTGEAPPPAGSSLTPLGPDDPKLVGKYRILYKIGEGGLGAVYLAEQRQPVVRRVALKIVKRGMDTKEVLGRFEQEHHALTLMNHPCIARVHDAGATERGRPYFVMEYVPGVPITAYCDREKLSTGERLRLFQQVCHGVQHAHQKAILHRDLKPGNILVMTLDGEPAPKIIDFGVAKATAQRLTEITLYTEVGQIIGTPEYMAPEQAEMTAVDIDTRADVYSLGVLLYELLVGRLPFEPETLRRAGYVEMQRIIREEEPERPSTKLSHLSGDDSALLAKRRQADLRTLVTQLRGDLDWVTMKALEKERARRYGSASELAADVGRFLGHEPVEARPPSAGYRLKKYLRRYRGPVMAAALVLMALLVGFTWALVERGRAVRARATAEENERLARDEKERADREAEAARAAQSEAEAERQRAKESEARALAEKVRADEALGRVLRLSDIKLVADYAAEADDLWPAHPERIEPMEKWLEKARELFERLPEHQSSLAELRKGAIPRTPEEAAADRASHPELPELEAAEGRLAWLRSLGAVVEGADPPAIPDLEGREVSEEARALNTLAWLRVDPARATYGEEALGLAYAERAAARAPEDPGILDTLAWARFATGRFAGAREASERALEVADEEKREEYEGYLEKLQGEIAGVTGPEGARRLDEQIAGLEGKVAALQEEVSQPRTWRFAGTEDEWQHNVLAELAGKLKSFGDPEAGIIHDVEGRLELARGIEERSITGPEARAAWARAIASISDRKECPLYEGLLIKPQLGFLPLGRNQRTELWEFWHMQTGERPEPNPEWPESAVNRWIITEKTGLVFVLIPGGTFRMGVEPPRLGAGAEETAEGLRVTAVQDGSLASALELEVGDVLRSLKGSAIDSPEALRAVVRTLRAGERVECTLLRGGSELALSAGVERGIGSPNIDPAARRNESPIHEVTLDPFFLAKYEMTQGQWLRFVGENPSYYGKGFNAAGHVIDLSHAVERVSWTMCDETLRHLGLVLPTEAQWEYGCRAGTTTVYWSGDGVSNLQGVANIADRSAKRAAPSWNCEMDLDDGFVLHAPVGSFGSNHFGLHDTHGGVWEWCRDGYGAYALPIAEGAGERQVEGPRGRVNRGGSFRGPAVLARSAGRSDDAPGLRYDSLGLRPASGITD